jgi:hypothetical protein
MIVELRRNPGADALLGLKESLDFASGAWATLFCRMGGAALLSQVGSGAGARSSGQRARASRGAPALHVLRPALMAPCLRPRPPFEPQ